MNEQEYKRFLEYIFNEYNRNRLPRIKDYYDHPKHFHNEYFALDELRKTAILTRYIYSYCDDSGDIYSTFTTEAIRRLLRRTEVGLKRSDRILEEAGYLDAFDAHFDEILEGIKPEYFPQIDLELLRDFGSTNPQVDLEGLIYLVKKRRGIYVGIEKQLSLRKQLAQAEEELTRAGKQLSEHTDNKTNVAEIPKKSRRWFKGIGQICQGAALSLADIGLAIGVFHFPVSPETQTWGSLVSTATGVGTVLNGIGELRGE